MRIFKGMVVFCLLLSGSPLAQGQSGDRGTNVTSPKILYYETINLQSNIPGRSRVDIVYRIDLSFFVGIRNEKVAKDTFIRRGEIQIELVDTTDQVAARDIESFIEKTEAAEFEPGAEWSQGMMTFNVTPGRYTIALTLEDLESARSISDQKRSVTALDFSLNSSVLSPPFFVVDDSVEGTAVTLQNYGGGIRFGGKAAFAFQIAGNSFSEPVRIQYKISAVGRQEPFLADTLEEQLVSNVALLSAQDGAPGYQVSESAGPNSFAVIRFDSEKLHPKEYIMSIEVIGGDSEHSRTKRFSVVWPEMPRSLRDGRYAFDALRYITTTDELDSLRSGSETEARHQFENFWEKKDRTPGTAFNEVMTEYYSRVDHAAMTFGTLRTPDGSRTDRGRIYILYGTPSNTHRKLDPAGFIETWSYQGIRKRFIFLDESKTGNYVLTASKPL